MAIFLKSASLNQNNEKNRNDNLGIPKKKNPEAPQNRANNSPNKFEGPETPAVGPFRPRQKPYQCNNCGSWGHSWWGCSILGNLSWRGLNGVEHPSHTPTQNP